MPYTRIMRGVPNHLMGSSPPEDPAQERERQLARAVVEQFRGDGRLCGRDGDVLPRNRGLGQDHKLAGVQNSPQLFLGVTIRPRGLTRVSGAAQDNGAKDECSQDYILYACNEQRCFDCRLCGEKPHPHSPMNPAWVRRNHTDLTKMASA